MVCLIIELYFCLRLELDLPIFDAGEVSVCPLLPPPKFDNLGWLKSVHVHGYALVVYTTYWFLLFCYFVLTSHYCTLGR